MDNFLEEQFGNSQMTRIIQNLFHDMQIIFHFFSQLFCIILDYLGLSQDISGYLWLSLAISGYLRISQNISGYLGLSQAISGYLGLSRATSGCLGLSRAIWGYLGLYLTLFIKFRVSGCKQKQERASYCYLKLFGSFSFHPDELQRSSRS